MVTTPKATLMSFEEYFTAAPIEYFASDRLNILEFLSNKFWKDEDYVVVWYGNLYKDRNPQKSTRNVKVFFVNKKNMSYQLEAFIPSELLLKMPIGAIVENGIVYAKYNFQEYLLQLNPENVNYINNTEEYFQNKEQPAFAFDPSVYPVKRFFREKVEHYIERDSNTFIVFQRNNTKFVIHPLIYFNASYGFSKKINSILLTYLWGDDETASKCVHNLLGLNRKLEDNPHAVFLPPGFRKKDVPFLYYLRSSKYTLELTKNLNQRVHGFFANRISSPLEVKQYHQGDSLVGIKGLRLGSTGTEEIVLCTEINMISFPKGLMINYFQDESVSKVTEGGVQIVNPVKTFDSDEVTVAYNDNANNRATEEITTRLRIIGDDSEINKIETQPKEVINSNKVVEVPEPTPSKFSVGLRTGSHGNVGKIRSYIDSDSERTDSNHHYNKLLEYAVELKHKKGSYFYDMTINCVTLKATYGEEIITITQSEDSDRKSLIDSIFVLRLKIKGNIFYLFDTDSYHQKLGLGIYVRDESYFKSSGSLASFESIVQELFVNDGRLLPQTFSSFGSKIGVFKHVTKSSNTNWIKTIVNKLRY